MACPGRDERVERKFLEEEYESLGANQMINGRDRSGGRVQTPRFWLLRQRADHGLGPRPPEEDSWRRTSLLGHVEWAVPAGLLGGGVQEAVGCTDLAIPLARLYKMETRSCHEERTSGQNTWVLVPAGPEVTEILQLASPPSPRKCREERNLP